MKNRIHMLKSVRDTICNSFIITTEDQKTIVIDGGFTCESKYFLPYLREVTRSEIPHIDAWFLSHPHADHAEVFYDVVENHFDEITLDKVYMNFPSAQFLERDDASAAQTVNEFYEILPKIAQSYTVVFGGDKIRIGEADIHVLCSPDFELTANICNNASIVFKMQLGGKSVMFLGDAGVELGEKLLRLYGESGVLKSDICQMAHHGSYGCGKSLYAAISPEICLWCTPSWLWSNKDGKGPYQTLEVRAWMEELGVRENFVNKDGTQILEL